MTAITRAHIDPKCCDMKPEGVGQTRLESVVVNESVKGSQTMSNGSGAQLNDDWAENWSPKAGVRSAAPFPLSFVVAGGTSMCADIVHCFAASPDYRLHAMQQVWPMS